MVNIQKKINTGDRVFEVLNFVFLTIGMLVVLYPLYFIVIASVSAPEAVQQGKTWLVPYGITFDGYKRILATPSIWTGYRNTIFYTVMGTFVNVAITLPAAYTLSRKNVVGKNVIMFLFAFTMFFEGGLIPTYLLVDNLNMINTVWAMIIPNALSVWNLIIARTFFSTNIPDELLEASKIDGCTDFTFFKSIVLPLSSALIAIMVLFYGVSHWNSYFNALIFMRDEELYSLQLILRTILIQNQVDENMVMNEARIADVVEVGELIKYGIIIIASLPLLILYPILQKYFVKGVMLGSIKG